MTSSLYTNMNGYLLDWSPRAEALCLFQSIKKGSIDYKSIAALIPMTIKQRDELIRDKIADRQTITELYIARQKTLYILNQMMKEASRA